MGNMKKYLSIYLLIALIFCLIGCDKQEEKYNEVDHTDKLSAYSVLLCDYSDSVASAKKTREYDFADREKYDSIKASQNKIKWIDGKLIVAAFHKQIYKDYNYFAEFEYSNDDFAFTIDEKNNLTFYCDFNKSKSTKVISEEEAFSKAEAFAENLINVSEYTSEIRFAEEYNEYFVEYRKYIGGIKTTEYAEVAVSLDGTIKSLSSRMLGRIPELKVDDIDFERIDQLIKDRLDEMYADSRKHYDEIIYGENDYKLTVLKDGSRGMVCNLEVRFHNYFEEYTETSGERLTFVVPLDQ